MKKAQFEIIGLVFIVALIGIGMIFFLNSLAVSNNESPSKTFILKTFAQDTLISMTKITLPCKAAGNVNYYLEELIADCGKSNVIYCDAVGLSSCNYSKTIIHNVLDATLTNVSKPFYFSSEELHMNKSYGNCHADSEGIPGFVVIPLYPGTVTLKLSICDQSSY